MPIYRNTESGHEVTVMPGTRLPKVYKEVKAGSKPTETKDDKPAKPAAKEKSNAKGKPTKPAAKSDGTESGEQTETEPTNAQTE